ncbi:MAG: hypothetical protein IJ612_03520 [Prevotella sp.]|nr:hypothetical protein [Prevotella sp.]
MKKIILIALCCFNYLLPSFTGRGWGWVCYADERTILLGPKTIGPGWKDNILLEARHFVNAQPGDVVTVYNDEAKRTAQAAFQDPQDWQGVASEYSCFNVGGPFRMTLTDDILNKVRARGVYIGGHDYRILRVTLTPGSEFVETIVWRGPAKMMKSDWSVSAELPASCFKTLKVGDGLRLHCSRVQDGAAAKIMDFTWNVLEPATDGLPVGPDGCTYYINDDAPLLKLQLAGTGDNTAMRIGGKDYRLDRVGIVQFTGQRSEDLTGVQRAPKEYKLQPGELFHGEKVFPNDWSGNLRLTAEPFQECTENDVIILHYTLLDDCEQPQISFRENRGKWRDLSGSEEPDWQKLDGNDVVLTFDEQSLDKVKTSGLVVTGLGFVLTRIELISAQ